MAESLDFSDRQLGQIIGVSWRRVRQMADEGKIPQPVAGRFDGPACVRAVIALAKSDRQPTALERANARRAEMSAAETEMRLSERRGDLIPVDVADAIIDRLAAIIRSEILGLPARVTRDMDFRRRVGEEVDASLDRISRRCADASADSRSPGDVLRSEAEGDA